VETPAAPSRPWRLGLHVGTVAIALVGVLCLDSNRRSLSGTFDESNHLAAGLEWWQFGSYTMWTENPPLPRLAIAALPYLHGMRLPPRAEWDPRTNKWYRSWEVGLDMLYPGAGFEQNLDWARLGTFPFFLIAPVAVKNSIRSSQAPSSPAGCRAESGAGRDPWAGRRLLWRE
jgi:hypothetical protein